jgi:2-methylisocitrate lyase-like PEP mutase family enzyme
MLPACMFIDEGSDMSVAERRARFHELHARQRIFVMPNPWDAGSARILQLCGFEALATTSAGYAWLLGKDDHRVKREELVAHVAEVAAAVDVPLSVDSERCFASDPAGVAETVRLLADAGAAGCSIEDWDAEAGRIDDPAHALELVAAAVEAAHDRPDPLVLTARAENHLHGVTDLDDTIARLLAYRSVGADCLYAPGLTDADQIAAVVQAVGAPVNILALPAAPPVPELERLGVRRVSTGSLLARTAYGAMLAGARELLASGTSEYAQVGITPEERAAAFGA